MNHITKDELIELKYQRGQVEHRLFTDAAKYQKGELTIINYLIGECMRKESADVVVDTTPTEGEER